MSGLSATVNPTYIDLQKVLSPDGRVAPVAEILNETNDGILDYITFQEGNLETGHRHQVRTGLPTVSRGRINKGVTATKGTTAQVTDNCAELESLSEIPSKLLEMAPDPGAFRLIQDRPHIEAMNQQFFRDLWYGDETVDPDNFTGLTPRFSDTTAANADNIINGGATVAGSASDPVYSIWLIDWSPMTCMGIIPKRSVANLQQEDWGERVLDDDGSNTGARIKVYSTYFRWRTGLAIPDWRHVVRIPNLKLSEIKDDASTGPNLPFLMKDAIERLPGIMGRPAFYMNRALVQKLRRQIPAQLDSSTLTYDMVGGTTPRRRMIFDEVFPVFRADSLVPRAANGTATTESLVTFS